MSTNLQQDARGLWAEQDKDAFRDYSLDWSSTLAPGDAIATSAWDPVPGLTLNSSAFTPGGITTIWVQGGVPGTWYAINNRITTIQGRTDEQVFRLYVQDGAAVSRSAIFANMADAVAALRRDRLVLMSQSLGIGADKMTDEFLYSKLLMAEASVARELRVFLQPTVILPEEAPQAEIDALEQAGTPYAMESAYDYSPDFFTGESWGYLVTKHRPIVSVQSIKLSYPLPHQSVFEVPSDWIRTDRKYGHIRMVPGSMLFSAPLAVFALPALGGGRMVPNMIQVRYTAGLRNIQRDWPDLVDAVLKTAVVSLIEDAMLPASGSISADGLSQSLSTDASKYRDAVERLLRGPPGSNGGLFTAIHGIVMGFPGAA
ncbi:MAG: hypothetical protein AB9M53_01010 [Leptothrix sp. (in: b-proteobacteria)]